MKNQIIILIFIIFSFPIFSQDELRQKVDYEINVTLDTLNQELNGVELITYHNRSSLNIDKIYVNLLANAYSSKKSTYFNKLQESFNEEYSFIRKKHLGGYQEFSFYASDGLLKYEYADNDKQIAIINLKKSIKPGESVIFRSVFKIKLPNDIDGFGYNKGQYNISNWYPKISTFYEGNWYPYTLNYYRLGYPEYGDYKVTIWFPDNYNIVAPGNNFQNQEEINHEKIMKPVNAGLSKMNFSLDNSDDFSWYVSKDIEKRIFVYSYNNTEIIAVNYYTKKDSIEDCDQDQFNSFFKSYFDYLYENGLELSFKNLHVIATPEIIVPRFTKGIISFAPKGYYNDILYLKESLCENLLKMAIRDQVRIDYCQNPWISEGLTSFLFRKYIENYDTNNKKKSYDYKGFKKYLDEGISKCFCEYKPATLNFDSYEVYPEFDLFVKQRTTNTFNYLDKLYDKGFLTKVFRKIFEQDSVKYRNVDDLIKKLNDELKIEDNWLTDGLLGKKYPYRYSIQNTEKKDQTTTITVKNEGNYKIPYKLKYYYKKTLLDSLFIDGHNGAKISTFNKTDGQKVKLEYSNFTKEYGGLVVSSYVKNRGINQTSSNLNRELHKNFLLVPMVAYNHYDGLQTGILLNNGTDDGSNSTTINLAYGWNSKKIVGMLRTEYTYKLDDNRSLKYGLKANSYDRQSIPNDDLKLKYLRISPWVKINFKNCDHNAFKNSLEYMFTAIADQKFEEKVIDFKRYYNEFRFVGSKSKLKSFQNFNFGLENQINNSNTSHNHILLTGEYNFEKLYLKYSFINFRLYFGAFLYNTKYNSPNNEIGSLSLMRTNFSDYKYQFPILVERSATESFWIRQLIPGYGGFKNGIDSRLGIGVSNKYVASFNSSITIPYVPVLKAFLDLGIYGNNNPEDSQKVKFIYSAGIEFEVIENKLSLYLPLLNSKEIENYYNKQFKKPFSGKISFFVNFEQLTE
jgi:hypothetical protein